MFLQNLWRDFRNNENGRFYKEVLGEIAGGISRDLFGENSDENFDEDYKTNLK